mgnify:CR=1 FL=1
MKPEHSKQLQHLYWRAGFGITSMKLHQKGKPIEEAIKLIKQARRVQKIPNMPTSGNGSGMMNGQAQRRSERKLTGEINAHWVEYMSKTNNPLLERMSLFWHDHFACRIVNSKMALNYIDAIRSNALGNFRDLLLAVSKSTAMIRYLNNQQNRKQRPNENFAREVMELFTLGRNNYTEKDIKEAARAFTGWSSNKQHDFEFRSKFHDTGQKNFMGITGNFKGEDIINIILSKKETAHYIVSKIYKYFVNEKAPSKRIKNLGDYFYRKDYDIGALMQKIFTSSWFYDPENIGTKIKSPIDFLVGLMKTIDLEFKSHKTILFVEKALGQVLFNPPNVAGWQGNKAWIDNATLLFRLNFVGFLFNRVEMSLKVKEGLEDKKLNRKVKKLIGEVSTNRLVKAFSKYKEAEISTVMTAVLLQPKVMIQPDFINQYTSNNSTKADYIESLAYRLMSTPEYQMC